MDPRCLYDLTGPAATLGALTNKVLIIGIDGTMPSAVAVARTPNLDALKSNGCHSVRVSRTGHPQCSLLVEHVHGRLGDKHLVNDPGNSFTGNQFTNYPSFFSASKPRTAISTPCFCALGTDADGGPGRRSGNVVQQRCRGHRRDLPAIDQCKSRRDVDAPARCDSAGHASGWGPTVSNYVRAVETADGHVGQIIGALRRRASYTNENWLVIVQTDHGEHDDPDPERSRIIFSIYSGPAAARGEIWPAPAIVDVCATVRPI